MKKYLPRTQNSSRVSEKMNSQGHDTNNTSAPSVNLWVRGLFLFFIIFFAAAFSLNVFADDDEFEDEEDFVAPPLTSTTEKTTTSGGTETKPVTTTNVKTTTKTAILKDSDGDGIADRNDPHPDIAEIYLVEDKNLNGIVDTFENGKQ